jgi:hypothetical protein
VHDAERPVAIADRVDENAEAVNVRELLEGERLALHLAPHGIEAFLPAGHPGLDALGCKLSL